MKKANFLRKVAIVFACLAVMTAFASCEPADEPAPGAPAFVEFSFASQRGTADIDAKKRTVKAVAECGTNLAALAPAFKLSPEGATATVDGKAQESGKTANNFADAVVYTLAAPDGTTAEWTVTITLPDDCPTPDVAYNPPADYYIEYTLDKNEAHSVHVTVCKIGNNYTEISHVNPESRVHYSGETMTAYIFGQGYWWIQNEGESWHTETVTTALAQSAEPFKQFWDFINSVHYSTDGKYAKRYYIRSDKFLGRSCGVYEFYDNNIMGNGLSRVWVDLETGCWLKWTNQNENTVYDEVTVFKLTDLKWDNTLRPEPYSSAKKP
jgi:hypothetical protein